MGHTLQAWLINIIRSFHDGMMARIVESGSVSDPFPVSSGIKQGCVLALTLFSLMFTTMLFLHSLPHMLASLVVTDEMVLFFWFGFFFVI